MSHHDFGRDHYQGPLWKALAMLAMSLALLFATYMLDARNKAAQQRHESQNKGGHVRP